MVTTNCGLVADVLVQDNVCKNSSPHGPAEDANQCKHPDTLELFRADTSYEDCTEMLSYCPPGWLVLTFCINSTRGRGGHESPRWFVDKTCVKHNIETESNLSLSSTPHAACSITSEGDR